LEVGRGVSAPSGNIVAGLVIGERRDHAPIHLDVIGVGASPYDVLNSAGQDVYGVNVSERATSLDKSGRLTFMNLRSQLWWQLREALDPTADNGIALPTVTSTLPQALYVNMTMPDATLYIYPVPSASFELHLMSVLELTQPSTLATTLVVPPGYLKAFRFNLAVEVATEFGIEPPPQVKRQAELSKRTIKRINNPDLLMSMPYGLVGRRRNNFNIYSGLPQ